jgi:hypothetical protein
VPLAIHPAHYLSVFYYYHYPAWSPDGRYISFVAESLHGEREIAVHPLSGQKPQEVRLRFDNYADSDWPSWAPALAAAGTAPTLYFRQGIRRDPGIETTETIRGAAPGSATPSSGEQWRLTAATFRSFTRTAEPGRAITLRSGHFAWSPDGRQLAFTLTPDPNDYSRSELWAMRRDGSGARRVSPADGRGYIAPVWVGTDRLGALSPRGARFDVVLLGIGHGGGRTLGAIDSSDCDWSPDRSRIVYAVRRAHGPSDNTDITTTLREIKTGLQVGQP